MSEINNQKALASLVVHIGLNDIQMRKGLSAMKSAVRTATNEWRSQFAILNQTGDHVGALKAKYDGLSKSIEAQKRVIQEQTSQLSAMGNRTEKNASAYDKLSSQINKNVKDVAAMTAQMDKAKHAYDFAQTGISKNRSELSLLQKEMQATVKMYQEQGKEQDANKAKAKGLQDQISKLTEIQGKEKTLLEKIKNDSGSDSDAYHNQAIRVKELASQIAHTKNDFSDLNKEMRRFSFSNIQNGLKKVNESATKTDGIFKKVLGADLLSRGISSAWVSITTGIRSAISAGSQYEKQQQVMNAAWTTLTNNAGKAKALVNMVNTLSVKTGQDAELTNELAQGFYHLHSSKSETEDMTKSLLNMGDAVGLTSDQLKSVGQDMIHDLSSGKLTLGGLNQISDYFPMFSEQMAKHYHVTVATLRQMVHAGKVSAADVETVFKHLGEVKYGKAADNMLSTMTGMDRVVKARVPALIGDFEKPFMKAKNPFYGAIAKWVSASHTDSLFNKMGKAASKGLTTITVAFGKVFGSKGVTKTADSAVSTLTKGITKFSDFIASHAKNIVNFFKSFKTDLTGLSKVAPQVVKDLASIAKPFIDIAVKHPKAFATVVIGIMGVTKAIKGFNVVMAISSAIAQANPITWIVDAVVAGAALIGVAAVEIVGHWKQIKKFFAPLGKWFKDVWHDISSGVHSFTSYVGSKWNSMKKSVESRTVSMAKSVRNGFNDMRKWSTSETNKMAIQVADKHSWLNKHTNNAFSNMFSGLKKTAKDGYKVQKDYTNTFKDFFTGHWNNLGKDFKKLTNDSWKKVKDSFHTGYNFLNDITGGTLGKMWDAVKKIGSKIVSFFKHLPHNMAVGIKDGAKDLANAGIFIGNKLIEGIQNVINGVINGIDWLLKTIDMPKIKDLRLDKIPYFANGTYDSMGKFYHDMVVHVGDGNKPELIRHKDGSITKTPAHDTLMMVRKGDSILGGDKTEQLLKMGLIPKFGIGSFFGDAIDFVKSAVSGVKSTTSKALTSLKSTASSIWNDISHPEKLLNSIMGNFTDSALGKLGSNMAKVGEGLIKYIIKGAGKWIYKQVGQAGNPSGSGVQRWKPEVIRALAMNHLSTSASMVSKVLRQIATESGGDPHAIQHGYTDINTMTGDLAKGLMQTISATFNANKFPGHGNIWNGFDNLLAALHYAKNRYGSSLSALGLGKGYANGGWSFTDQLAHISEGNKTEMVLPLTDTNRSIQLMYQALDYLENKQNKTSSNSNNNTTASDNTVQLLMAQNNTLMEQNNSLMQALISVVQNKPTGITPAAVYQANKQYSNKITRNTNLAKGILTNG